MRGFLFLLWRTSRWISFFLSNFYLFCQSAVYVAWAQSIFSHNLCVALCLFYSWKFHLLFNLLSSYFFFCCSPHMFRVFCMIFHHVPSNLGLMVKLKTSWYSVEHTIFYKCLLADFFFPTSIQMHFHFGGRWSSIDTNTQRHSHAHIHTYTHPHCRTWLYFIK